MGRRLEVAIAAGAAAYVGGSWLLAKSVTRRLISSEALIPASSRRADLLAALSASGARVFDFRSKGAAADPVDVAAILATPAEPSRRGTIVFLHGKGGNAAEWTPDALRAIAQGYNALLPDLRAHRPSGGEFVTYGYLESEDLAHTVADAAAFGLDPRRLALHSCSAGSWIALRFAAADSGVRGLWLESPFADARQMARHYLSLTTGLPSWALGLTTFFAVESAIGTIRRSLHLPADAPGLEMDSLSVAARVRAPVYLVYGERDALVPPAFTRRLAAAFAPGTQVWNPQGAGHCHHDDEAERVAAAEYDARWTKFFDSVFGGRSAPSGS